ncbi:hypothetical protein EI94DRAFT_1714047, partial [Lactarius quietus]
MTRCRFHRLKILLGCWCAVQFLFGPRTSLAKCNFKFWSVRTKSQTSTICDWWTRLSENQMRISSTLKHTSVSVTGASDPTKIITSEWSLSERGVPWHLLCSTHDV